MVIWRAVWLMLTLAGCSVLAPRLAVHTEAESRNCRAAPLVIVGVIESDEATGRLTANMQLRRLGIRVENVLRGVLDQPAITAYSYYFNFDRGYSGYKALGLWDKHSLRRVFWLQQDAGVPAATNSGFHRQTEQRRRR